MIAFYFLAAYTEPSDAGRTSPQGEGLQVSSSLVPPSPVPKVCDVFNNGVLPANSGRQPRVMSIAYMCWESLGLLSTTTCWEASRAWLHFFFYSEKSSCYCLIPFKHFSNCTIKAGGIALRYSALLACMSILVSSFVALLKH